MAYTTPTGYTISEEVVQAAQYAESLINVPWQIIISQWHYENPKGVEKGGGAYANYNLAGLKNPKTGKFYKFNNEKEFVDQWAKSFKTEYKGYYSQVQGSKTLSEYISGLFSSSKGGTNKYNVNYEGTMSKTNYQNAVAGRMKNLFGVDVNYNFSNNIIKNQIPSGYVGPLNKGQSYAEGIEMPSGSDYALEDTDEEPEKGNVAWYKKIWDTITQPMKKGVAGIGIALIIIVLLFLIFFALNNKMGSKILKETKNIDVEKNTERG